MVFFYLYLVDEYVVIRLFFVKVVRYVNGLLVWVELNLVDYYFSYIFLDFVIREYFVNSNVNGVDFCRIKDGILIIE